MRGREGGRALFAPDTVWIGLGCDWSGLAEAGEGLSYGEGRKEGGREGGVNLCFTADKPVRSHLQCVYIVCSVIGQFTLAYRKAMSRPHPF